MDYNPYEVWKGKHICFLGDSITDAVTVNVGERYFELLAEKVGEGLPTSLSPDDFTPRSKRILEMSIAAARSISGG